jgi:ABC-type branched-subunit amino acid transport system ATPase component
VFWTCRGWAGQNIASSSTSGHSHRAVLLLMLDEPSFGLTPVLVPRIYETIGEINRSGVTILLVEQSTN